MSNSNPFAVHIPPFQTEFTWTDSLGNLITVNLASAVEAIRDALASKPAARDTAAHDHLRALIETMRALGL